MSKYKKWEQKYTITSSCELGEWYDREEDKRLLPAYVEQFNGYVPAEKVQGLVNLIHQNIVSAKVEDLPSVRLDLQNTALLLQLFSNDSMTNDDAMAFMQANGCSKEDFERAAFLACSLGVNTRIIDFYRDFVNDNSSEYDYYLNVALDKKYQEALDCEEAYGDMGMGN